MRAFAVLAFLDGVVEAVVDDLLLSDDHLLHAVHEGPADSSAVSGIDESVLRACVEGIFAVHELRMQHHVTLLRRGLHVRKTFPVHKVLGAGNSGSGHCGRKVSRRC